MADTKLLTEAEWSAKYRPVNDSPLDWTEPDDLAQIKAADAYHTWTQVQGDSGADCLLNGYHSVNRIGYWVCEAPWVEGEQIEVDFSGEDELGYNDADRDRHLANLTGRPQEPNTLWIGFHTDPVSYEDADCEQIAAKARAKFGRPVQWYRLPLDHPEHVIWADPAAGTVDLKGPRRMQEWTTD